MLWKIYFWVLLLTVAGGSMMMIPQISNFTLADFEGLAEGIVLVLAVNAYVYKGVKFPARAWAVLFVAVAVIWALQILTYAGILPFAFLQTRSFEISLLQVLGTMAFSAPAMYTMYKMGFVKS